MSIHVCKCIRKGYEEYHLRYPGMTENEAQEIADKINAGMLDQQKSLDWIELRKKAEEIVKSKYVYQKFIDGTPLENDIACWMADFVIDQLNEITE